MTDGAIDSEEFYLFDNWPGTPLQSAAVPTGGFTGSAHHNVSSPAYPVGTKIAVMNTHASYQIGGSVFIYLRNIEIVSTSVPVAVKHWVIPKNTSNWYEVTNENNSILADAGTPGAIGLSTMSTTTGYYGWFWCGGVCPTQYVTDLDGDFVTDSTVVAGPNVLSNLLASGATYGTIGPAVATSTTLNLPAIFSLAAD